jgi:hypothetical protein
MYYCSRQIIQSLVGNENLEKHLVKKWYACFIQLVRICRPYRLKHGIVVVHGP